MKYLPMTPTASRLHRPNAGTSLPKSLGSPSVRNIVITLLAMIATACEAPPAADSQEVVVRDSAGIRIVENAPPDEGLPLWTVAETPELAIESRAGDGSFILHQVSEARFLSDGRVVVHNGGFELLWFDASGNLLARGGGAGEGPSESLSVVRLEILDGDTLLAVSRRPSSWKIFGPDGRFVRSDPVRFLPSVVTMGRLGDGTWAGISFGGESAPARTGVFREQFHVVRYSPDLMSVDTLLALGANAYYGDRNGSVSLRGGPRGHFVVGGGVVVAGDSETYDLKVFGAGGELLHVIRASMPNPADPRLIELARVVAARTGEGGARPRRLEAPVMETAPAYDWVFVANNGDVWVRRRAGPDQETVRTNIRWSSSSFTSTSGPLWVAEGLDGQEWHVFDLQGRLSARALLPARFRPTEITASRILGVWRDEVDVESVRVFQLIRE